MNVKDYLNQQGIRYETRPHSRVITAQELAAVEHVPGDKLAKPVVVELDDGSNVLVVCPASYRVDLARVAEELHAKVKLAPESRMRELFPDAELGAEPPFGSLYGLPTLVDQSLASADEITFRAGKHTETITMDWRDYQKLERPKVAAIARHL